MKGHETEYHVGLLDLVAPTEQSPSFLQAVYDIPKTASSLEPFFL